MILELSNKIILRGAKPETCQAVKERLTISNPKYAEAVKMGRYLGNLAPELKFYEETDQGLVCPRGAAGQIFRLCRGHGEDIRFVDNRRSLDPVDFSFHGQLRDFQKAAVGDCLKKDFGLLSAPTGSGKTVMAAYMIKKRQQPTLVVVHTRELLSQWAEQIKSFLGIDAGTIGGGKFEIRPVTVATVQSLAKCAAEVAPNFGHLIVDEAHHVPALQTARAVEAFDCQYMTGLSATPYRRDGLSKVIFWHIGDLVAEVDKESLVDNGDLCPAEVVWVETEFTPWADATEEYTRALSELAANDNRNRLIARTVAANNGHGVSLILSDRKAHCEALRTLLETRHGIKAEILTGDAGARERERIINDLNQGRCKYLVATGQLCGEGFDLAGISSMFLTTPIKHCGRVVQYLGRALRPAPGKSKAIIYDFVDVRNPVFAAQARSRQKTYERQLINERQAA